MARGFTAYKIHKKMYPASYNFKDDDNASAPTGWTTNNGGTTTTVIAASQGIHKKVLVCTDADGANTYDIEIDFSSAQTTGIVDLWFQTDDNTAISYLQLLQADNTIAIQVDLNAIAGVGDDTWYHYSISFDCTPDTYQHWLDGSSIASGVAFTNAVTNIITIKFTSTAAASVVAYFDAIGFSWDANYVSGDNIFWRNLKDQDSDFESEDVGTSGTSIDFIDTVTTVEDADNKVEIVPSFDEHKKILRLTDQDAGNLTTVIQDFGAAIVSGTIEFYFRVSDATSGYAVMSTRDDVPVTITVIDLRIGQNTNEFLEYYDGAWHDIVAISDNTWYHAKVEFECGAGAYKGLAADKWNIWVNNVKYGPFDFRNAANEMGDWLMGTTIAADLGNLDIDAVSYSWTSGNEVADNRIFEYNTDYTKIDITSLVSYVKLTNDYLQPLLLDFVSTSEYEFTEVFFQFYDVNSKFAFEGEIRNRFQAGSERTYKLRDKNWDDYQEPLTQAFSSAKIHDPAVTGSMLKTVIPNISHKDGDFILVDADTKTDTYSPTLRSYPTGMFLRDLADVGDSNVIIYPNGKIHLDDDLASGVSLDVDTLADKNKMASPPLPNNIIESFNYFEIFGAINPFTGQRYSKVTDNSGTDKKHKYRYINNNFRNQTDVDAYAAKLVSRVVTALQVTQKFMDLGVLETGTLMTYKYVKGEINIPSASYVIIRQVSFLHSNTSIITFSEGVIESSKYGNYYERGLENTNVFASEIYESDINTISVNINTWNGSTAVAFGGVLMDAVNEAAATNVFISSKVDVARDILIYLVIYHDNAIANYSIDIDVSYTAADCSDGAATDIINVTEDLVCETDAKVSYIEKTIPGGTIAANTILWIILSNNEVAPAAITLHNVTVQYFVKRTVS